MQAGGSGMTRNQELIAALEREHGSWQVWAVHHAEGRQRFTFCARRWDGSGRVLNEDTAEALAAAIEQAEQEG